MSDDTINLIVETMDGDEDVYPVTKGKDRWWVDNRVLVVKYDGHFNNYPFENVRRYHTGDKSSDSITTTETVAIGEST